MRLFPGKLILPVLILLLLGTSCVSPRFISAADMFGIYGVLSKTDGSKMSGYFTNTSANLGGSGLYYCSKESKKISDYHLISFKVIISIEIRGDVYEPRLLEISPTGNNKYVMVKKISPKGYTKMCLYELDYDESDKSSQAGQSSPSFTQKKYYVQLSGGPNMPIWDIESTKFSPSFNLKMSEIVADCPALSKKVKNKEAGYFYRLIHDPNNTLPVFQRIIAEYNDCK